MSESEYKELKEKIFKLEVNSSILEVRIRSLVRLLEIKEENEKGSHEHFRAALRELEQFYSNEILGTYSDDHPDLASLAKRHFDEAFSDTETSEE